MNRSRTHWWDGLIRAEVEVCNRRSPAFRVFICGGVLFGCWFASLLTVLKGESLTVMFLIAAASISACLIQVVVVKIVSGEERSAYYRQLLLILGTSATVAYILDRSPIVYLDLTILGMGALHTVGRVGCLMAGCCHGRPHRLGIRYSEEHARQGFPDHLVGVRLFPIQLVESFWVLTITAIGCVILLTQTTPGMALSWYIVAYSTGRFCFEFLRGDPERPYLLGFSEAQWISVGLACAVVVVERLGFLPFRFWNAAALVAMVATMISVAAQRGLRAGPTPCLAQPRHLDEIAQALAVLSKRMDQAATASLFGPNAGGIMVGRTSLGIQVSLGVTGQNRAEVYHYTISSSKAQLTGKSARTIANLILRLKGHCGPTQLIRGNEGFFHLLVQEDQTNVRLPAVAALSEETGYAI